MKTLITSLAIILFSCFFSQSGFSQIIQSFNFQGVLQDDEGRPIANEAVTINVQIPQANLNYTTSATTSSLGAFSVPIEIGKKLQI